MSGRNGIRESRLASYTDIAQFVDLNEGKGRRLLLARNLGMAREYGVLDRVFYGSDYVGESVDEYVSLLQREIAYLKEGVDIDMKKLGYSGLTPHELQGLLSRNVLKLWRRSMT